MKRKKKNTENEAPDVEQIISNIETNVSVN
jgi:hypothetical protein